MRDFNDIAATLKRFHKETQNQFDSAIIYQVGNTTVVGDSVIKTVSDGFEVGIHPACFTTFGYENPVFSRFESALCFCLARHDDLYQLANDIIIADRKVSELYFDQQNFSRLLKLAIKKQNYFKENFYKTKLEEVTTQLKIHLRKLNLLCQKAKYLE